MTNDQIPLITRKVCNVIASALDDGCERECDKRNIYSAYQWFAATPGTGTGGSADQIAFRTQLQADMAAMFALIDALVAGDYAALKAQVAALVP